MTETTETPISAWHFLPTDRRLGYDDGRLVVPGETLTVDVEPRLCDAGLHGSRLLIDALQWAPGPVVCRVEISGDVAEGANKLTGRRRRCLWMADATETLHEFGCRCAEDALALVEAPDPRSVAAIEAKRRWIRGEIGDEELGLAADAAWAGGGAAWVAGVTWAAADWATRAAAHTVCGWGAARTAQNRRLTAMISALPREG